MAKFIIHSLLLSIAALPSALAVSLRRIERHETTVARAGSPLTVDQFSTVAQQGKRRERREREAAERERKTLAAMDDAITDAEKKTKKIRDGDWPSITLQKLSEYANIAEQQPDEPASEKDVSAWVERIKKKYTLYMAIGKLQYYFGSALLQRDQGDDSLNYSVWRTRALESFNAAADVAETIENSEHWDSEYGQMWRAAACMWRAQVHLMPRDARRMGDFDRNEALNQYHAAELLSEGAGAGVESLVEDEEPRRKFAQLRAEPLIQQAKTQINAKNSGAAEDSLKQVFAQVLGFSEKVAKAAAGVALRKVETYVRRARSGKAGNGRTQVTLDQLYVIGYIETARLSKHDEKMALPSIENALYTLGYDVDAASTKKTAEKALAILRRGALSPRLGDKLRHHSVGFTGLRKIARDFGAAEKREEKSHRFPLLKRYGGRF